MVGRLQQGQRAERRLLILLSVMQGKFDEREAVIAKKYASPGTEITCAHLDRGPESIESYYDEAFAIPGLLEEVKQAEDQGYDGVLISCFADVGVDAAREMASIPVLGVGHPSMLMASAVAREFSVVTVVRELVPLIEDTARKWGISGLASVRNVGIAVLELDDEAGLTSALYEQTVNTIDQDGAQAIVLGCTGIIAAAENLHAMLAKKKRLDVPVIDPALIALKCLEAFVTLGIKQSKLRYMMPAQKRRTA